MQVVLLTISLYINLYFFYFLFKREDIKTGFRIFSIYLILIFSSLWIGTNLIFQVFDPTRLYWVAIVSYLAGLLSLFSVFLFILGYRDGVLKSKRKFLLLTFLIPTSVMLFLVLSPGSILIEVAKIESGFQLVTTDLINYYGALLLSIFFFIPLYGVYEYKVADAFSKNRLRVFIIASLFSMLWGILFNFILPLFGNFSFTWLGPVSMLIWNGSIIYSIVKYRLFDIRFALGYSIYIIALGLFAFASFYFIYFIEVWIWGGVTEKGALTAGVIFAFLYVWLQKRLSDFFLQIVEKYVIYEGISKYELLAKLSTALASEFDYEKITDEVFNALDIVSEAAGFSVSILGKENTVVFSRQSKGFDSLISEGLYGNLQALWSGGFIDFISLVSEREESKMELARVLKLMTEFDIGLIVPLESRGQLIGYLFFKRKGSFRPYTDKEVDLISDITTASSVAYSRAVLYQEVNSFNLTLQGKIDAATAELAERYDELKRIRERERDMMDIMGHELRTPLSIIKITLGSLKMKAERDPESVKAEAFLKEYPKLDNALKREIELLETMLTSTKIDASKLELNLEDVDMVEVLEDAILGQQEKAQEKGLKVEFKKPKGPVHAYVDKVRVGEVVDNFMSNAVKYTEQGVVSLELVSTKDSVTVKVIDSGQGMPPEALQRLGEKFYRVKQYVTDETGERKEIVRPGGTGLGLYVSFNLVKLMQGTYDIESEVGKGSIFSFTVPKYAGQERAVKGSKGKDLFARMGLR